MKRSYLLLAMVLQLQILPVATFADTQNIDGIEENQSAEEKVVSHKHVRINGIYYNLYDKTKEAEVTDGVGGVHDLKEDNTRTTYVGDITIPSTVKYGGSTYKVTGIANEAFRFMAGVTSINIPNSVTSIGAIAFGGCVKLTTITIPNSITSIDYAAFDHCEKLQSITIPKSVTFIGQAPLANCASLKTIIVDKDNKVYDSRNNCNAIIDTETNELMQGCQNTIIPNTVTRVGYYSFEGMTGLKSIDIPNSVTSIGTGAFDSSGLTTLTIPNSVIYIDNSIVSGCANLKSITLSESLKYIPEGTFLGCHALESITIPASVESIEWDAFFDCENLKSMTFQSTTPPTADINYFHYTYFGITSYNSIIDKLTIHVPVGYKDIYKTTNNDAFNEVWKNATIVDDAVVPQNITGIDNVTTAITQQPSAIFDLTGKRLTEPQKGINIINGKKVIIK